MPTFTQKPDQRRNQAQGLARYDAMTFAPGHWANPNQQAMPPIPQINPDRHHAALAAAASSRTSFDFSRIPIHSAALAAQTEPLANEWGDQPEQEPKEAHATAHREGGLSNVFHSRFEPPGHDFGRVRTYADAEMVRAVAEQGVSGSGGPLPYFAEIQRSFGRHDVSQVVAYQGSRAAAAARVIGALAFTTGDRVAFAGAPDLYTAAHEAAHAVQQRAGVNLTGDVGKAGDSYERHADAVADQVVRGRRAESLLDQTAPPGSPHLSVQRQVLQCKTIPTKPIPATNFGTFTVTKYEDVGPSGSETGVLINLEFDPDPAKVDFTDRIGLVQAARTQIGGAAIANEPSLRGRMVPSGTGEGYLIDRTARQQFSDPIYASQVPSAGAKLGETPIDPRGGQFARFFKDAGVVKHDVAKLNDRAHQPGRGNNSGQTLETAALAVEGKHAGTYMGSITWGWSVDSAGKFGPLLPSLQSKGNPSASFKAAAKLWNKGTTAGTIKTTANPTQVYDTDWSPKFTVDKDTEVDPMPGSVIDKNIVYYDVTIKSGPKTGKVGAIKATDVADVGGGKPLIKLPIP